MDSEGGVTYSFKDLFDKFDTSLSDGFRRLDLRLDEINRKIDQKADTKQVSAIEIRHAEYEAKIEDRFVGVDKRFKPLEDAQVETRAVRGVKDRWLAFLAAVVVALISALTYIVANGGFH